MMRTVKYSAAVLLLLLMVSPLWAGLSGSVTDPGDSSYPVSWLRLPASATAAGYGEAYISVAEGLDSIYYNPGTLVKAKAGMMISGALLPESRLLGSLVFGWQSKLSDERIVSKAVSAAYVTATGVKGYDATGNSAADPQVYGISGQFAMAWSMAANPAAGGYGFSIRGIYDNVDGEQGFGASFNAGADLTLMNILRLAVAVRNIGLMQYQDTLWMKPWLAGSLIVNVPGVPLAVIVQVDKTLWSDEKPVTRLATHFTLFSKKLNKDEQGYQQAYQDILNDDLNKPVKTGKADQQPGTVELQMRAGLAHSRLFGGLTFQWNSFELSYALGFQPENSAAGHFVSINLNF